MCALPPRLRSDLCQSQRSIGERSDEEIAVIRSVRSWLLKAADEAGGDPAAAQAAPSADPPTQSSTEANGGGARQDPTQQARNSLLGRLQEFHFADEGDNSELSAHASEPQLRSRLSELESERRALFEWCSQLLNMFNDEQGVVSLSC